MHAPLLDPGGVLAACLSASRAAAFRPLETVGFPLDPTWRDILVSTTILIAGLHHAACILATPGSVQPLAGMHAGSLLTCWRGFRQVGLEPFPVLTHWATTTNFMGLLPFPRFRAYLGVTFPAPCRAVTVTVPAGVNFTALLRRFMRICFILS